MAFMFLKRKIVFLYPEPAAKRCRHERGDTASTSRHELPRAEDADRLSRRMTALQQALKKIEEKAKKEKDKVKRLCKMLLNYLGDTNAFIEARIDDQEVRVFKKIMNEIRTVKTREDVLSQEIRRVEGLCDQVDPVAFMQDSKRFKELERPGYQSEPPPRRYADIDAMVVSLKLKKNFDKFAQYVHTLLASHCPHLKHQADFQLNDATVGASLPMTPTAETEDRPRSRAYNLLIESTFSSGKHYWEVIVSREGVKSVGVAYPSMENTGRRKYLGHNRKSWCLTWCCEYTEARHNSQRRKVASGAADLTSVAVYLDYEAGRLSFYRISPYIVHLYTFSANFTEPLQPAFYTFNSSIKVDS